MNKAHAGPGRATQARPLSYQLREWLKVYLPRPAQRLISAVRDAVAAPALEEITLHDYDVVADHAAEPRLNLVLPTLDPAHAFGGVMTGLDLTFNIAGRCDLPVRIIGDRIGDAPDRQLITRAAADRGYRGQLDIEVRDGWKPVLGVRARDVFITFNWWTTLNFRKVVAQQASLFRQEPVPLVYLLQEFEPGFYELSSTHMHALDAVSGQADCLFVLNSSQLARYLDALGIGPRERYVIEPVIAESLRPHFAPETAKQRRILAYGRPQIARNCFPALVKGLQWWADTYPRAREWELVSAGTAHPAVELGAGLTLHSLGKLSMQGYAAELNRCAMGVSLMASPHPSYPPLEMANFGMMAITNAYPGKTPAELHPNIISIDTIAPDAIGLAMIAACERFEADPSSAGLRGKAGSEFLDPSRNEAVYAALADRLASLARGGGAE